MITPSHLIYSWAIAKKLDEQADETQTSRVRAFVLGALIPDLPTYLFFFVHTILLGTSQQVLWNEVYFDSAWTPFITLSHSLWLWPVLIVLGYALGRHWLRWLATSATLHVVLDFFVHADDAYRHFWPFSNCIWQSPLSYWDPNYFGGVVSTIDTVVILAILVWLWRQYQNRSIRTLISVLATIYLLVSFTPITAVFFN